MFIWGSYHRDVKNERQSGLSLIYTHYPFVEREIRNDYRIYYKITVFIDYLINTNIS